MAKTKFIIKQGDVYYLTTGKLLTYDLAAAKGDPKKEKDVEFVAAKFKEIHDSPHTWYPAVRVADANFSAINTGESD